MRRPPLAPPCSGSPQNRQRASGTHMCFLSARPSTAAPSSRARWVEGVARDCTVGCGGSVLVMLGCFGYRERVGLRLSFLCLFCKLVSVSGEFLYFFYLCWVGQDMRKRQEKECHLFFYPLLISPLLFPFSTAKGRDLGQQK